MYHDEHDGPAYDSSRDFADSGMSPPLGVDDDNENFKVAIRVRPPLPRELESSRQFVNVVRIPQDHKSITLCEHLDIDESRAGVYSTQTFTFDQVYDLQSSQEQVYERSAHSVVNSVLEGYNATLIAYGQTGTGKTFTMEGFTNNENRGIIPRATEEIFSYIHSCRNKDMKFLVRASYLQIYNEVISDLLKPLNKQLSVRHTRHSGVCIDGLSEWIVRSPNEVYGLMERGCSLRATGSHKMSELSSRSHAMFIIVVEVVEGDEENPKSYKCGKLNIVDLAGSEKVRQTGVTGVRLNETKKINWSLHELGNVIAALTDAKRRDKHIPFRNSCLTRVLQDSLGGNCKTTLIACISPALEAYSESLSTLKFANRAKNIKNEATVNENVDNGALLRRYEKEVQRLKQMLTERTGDYVDRGPVQEDHRAALEALEHTSRAMGEEQENRKRLEGRIRELEGLLGGGGVHPDGSPVAAEEYAMQLDELARERQVMEEDKAQVSRYKQLLLKQRDIMLGLTTRLNERDETILQLQEEIDAYDAHIQMLEDAMDANATTIATRSEAESYLNSIGQGGRYRSEGNPNHWLNSEEKIVELLMIKGKGGKSDGVNKDVEMALRDRVDTVARRMVDTRCSALHAELDDLHRQLAASHERQRAAESAMARNPDAEQIRRIVQQEQAAVRAQMSAKMNQAVQDAEKMRNVNRQLTSELDRLKFDVSSMRQGTPGSKADLDRLYSAVLAVEESIASTISVATPRHHHRDPTGGVSSSSASSQQQTGALEAAVSKLREEKASLAAQLRDRDAIIADLQQRNASDRGDAESKALVEAQKREIATLTRSLNTHVKDRRALKTILESRIKSKVETVRELLASSGDKDRALTELKALQNLVNASVAAMDSGAA